MINFVSRANVFLLYLIIRNWYGDMHKDVFKIEPEYFAVTKLIKKFTKSV